MAATDYTSAAEVAALAGSTAVDLRTDDAASDTLTGDAVSYAGGEIDFYCQGKYLAADLAAVQWVRNTATAFALEWLCLHRLNAVPKSLAKMCDGYREKWDLVRKNQAVVPGAARGRRPATVTNTAEDLQRKNNQTRVDTTKSTGTAQGYTRPTDPNAPDER